MAGAKDAPAIYFCTIAILWNITPSPGVLEAIGTLLGRRNTAIHPLAGSTTLDGF